MTDLATAAPADDPAAADSIAPPPVAPDPRALDALVAFVERHPRLFVLTGAGVSTDSGIPGYRDRHGAWMCAAPIQWQAFVGSDAARRRYWARSMIGWPVVDRARPNGAHRALAHLGAAGRVARLVTQNVDGLHAQAGSADAIELHGSIARVTCLDCRTSHAREAIQRILEADNPALVGVDAAPAADGDAHLDWAALDAFHVPVCPACGGMLKPDVVFFGENVPRERVDAAATALNAAGAVLVAGSSLMVYSGYRFCAWAHAARKPIAAVNFGRTRADALLALKIEASCAATLEALAARAARCV